MGYQAKDGRQRLERFARALRCRVRDLAITQRELARLVQVDPSTVTCWIRGSVMPGRDNLDRLAAALSCTADDLDPRQVGPADTLPARLKLLLPEHRAAISALVDSYLRQYSGTPLQRSRTWGPRRGGAGAAAQVG